KHLLRRDTRITVSFREGRRRHSPAGHLRAAGDTGRIRRAAHHLLRPMECPMPGATEANPNVVDVRSLVPAERHSKIFELVNQLAPSASFVLVNDHDPKPLYYQLEAEYPK